MQNVEFKAELRDVDLARTICLALGAMPVATLLQTDTYYQMAAGRLKRRVVPDEPTQYVFYHRADRSRPKISQFTLYNESEAMLLYGVQHLPVWVVVRKTRELLMLGHTRIHLDVVEDLGSFVEFESVVSPSNHVGRAHEAISRLRGELKVCMGEAIACGYSDLMAQQAEAG